MMCFSSATKTKRQPLLFFRPFRLKRLERAQIISCRRLIVRQRRIFFFYHNIILTILRILLFFLIHVTRVLSRQRSLRNDNNIIHYYCDARVILPLFLLAFGWTKIALKTDKVCRRIFTVRSRDFGSTSEQHNARRRAHDDIPELSSTISVEPT